MPRLLSCVRPIRFWLTENTMPLDLSKLTADLQAACDKHNSGERVGQPVEVRVQVGALRQAYKSGRCHGLIDAHDWLRANGFKEAAHELTRAAAKIRERIDSEPHRA